MPGPFLQLVHLRKSSGLLKSGETLGGFHVDTCQRQLWLLPGSVPIRSEFLHGSAELFVDSEAYRFLLRVATGLESEIQGETDIFGQLKDAWQNHLDLDGAWGHELSPWVQRIFEDTKEIRARYLQNVGGESYGSLVRKLLRQHALGDRDRVLLLGAGKLAHSIGPWLMDYSLRIWNRTPASAEKLVRELLDRRPGDVLATADLKSALPTARALVVCVPTDPARDQEWIELWKKGGELRPVIHLGAPHNASGEWSRLPRLHPLDDLFAIQKEQNTLRAQQFERAAHACDEKALLRSLSAAYGGSTTVAHGWEDLAAFA